MSSTDSHLIVQSGDLSYELAPEVAGRVVQMKHRQTSFLIGPAVNPDNWGATYWTSPQGDWSWPPVPAVDSEPYEPEPVPGGYLLTSRVATIGKRTFRIKKRFVRGALPGSIDTHYSIVNVGAEAFSMANWEIARVFPGGMTFFPTGDHELTPIAPHHFMTTDKLDGYTIFDHRKFELGRSLKLHADAEGGFLAHATEDHLVLKLFRDTRSEHQAPGEGECELFSNFDGQYVEIEVQGPYVAIAPGLSNDLLVRTVVVPLPKRLSVSTFDEVARFAREQVERFATPDLCVPWEPDV